MIRFNLKKNKNPKSTSYDKYFAYPHIDETVDLEGLSKHMASHNSPFSAGAIRGMLTDMVTCVKEILLEGKNVKIDDLAIFSIGIRNSKGGSVNEEDFTVTSNIQSVKLRARATGQLSNKKLDLEATLKRTTLTTKTPTVNEAA